MTDRFPPHEWGKERRDQELLETAARLGIELSDERRRNGDRIMIAVLERVVDLQNRFVAHEQQQERVYLSVILMIGGACAASLPAIFPAVEAGVRSMGVTVPHGPIAWPAELLQTAGGLMMVSGLVLAFMPKLVRPMLGRAYPVVEAISPALGRIISGIGKR
jgi:hypothetical protein